MTGETVVGIVAFTSCVGANEDAVLWSGVEELSGGVGEAAPPLLAGAVGDDDDSLLLNGGAVAGGADDT